MPAHNPADRAMISRIGGLTKAAKTIDRKGATAAARDARWRKYLDQVDPDHTMPEVERIRRAQALRTADMTRLALRSAQARRAAAAAKAAEQAADRELAELAALSKVDGAA